MKRSVHGNDIVGVEVDAETRCSHWNGLSDVIAIKFKCCGQWYPCYECHAAVADHPTETWPSEAYNSKAILCGACGHELTISEYLTCNSACPSCGRAFNPGCANHYYLYFEL
ncbi:MAG TPA: CHY zinc finger protein [Pyrinomonadaceae bacterium]|nr:CHY zinc finger protein [Pyrinomonadaceae bacterium]